MKTFPTLRFEKDLWKENFLVIGIDEVGRGAFAGPLVVGGVIFKPCDKQTIIHLESLGINDSKKLTSTKRKNLSGIIKNIALYTECTNIDVETINKIGIGKATQLAMRELVKKIISTLSLQNPIYQLPATNYYLLIDAFEVDGINNIDQKAIIQGDSISLSIAAASIMAKVKRDTVMEELSLHYPLYGWERNKGYGTAEHRKAIQEYGSTPLHRDDFIRATLLH